MALCASVFLAACAGATGPSGPSPSRGLALVPAEGGLDVVPTGREIGFGRHQPGAIAAAARVLGRDPRSIETRTDCAGGVLTLATWPRDDLAMVFVDQAFVGWQTSEAAAGRVCDGGP